MKKILITLVVTFFIVIGCMASDNPRHLSIGIIYRPNFGYRTLKPNSTPYAQYIAHLRDSIEIPKFGYATGLSFVYRFTKRLAFETGLQFSQGGYKTKKNYPDWGTTSPSLPKMVVDDYNYNYLNIPVKLNIYLLTGRVQVFISGLASANVLLSNTKVSTLQFDDGHTSTQDQIAPKNASFFNFAAAASIGFGFDLTKRLNLTLEPNYKKSITSLDNSAIKGYLYSAGVTAGLYFKL
ncbi:MAG: outer membrane beta-barrel protein [Bacteroidia bacterium]